MYTVELTESQLIEAAAVLGAHFHSQSNVGAYRALIQVIKNKNLYDKYDNAYYKFKTEQIKCGINHAPDVGVIYY